MGANASKSVGGTRGAALALSVALGAACSPEDAPRATDPGAAPERPVPGPRPAAGGRVRVPAPDRAPVPPSAGSPSSAPDADNAEAGTLTPERLIAGFSDGSLPLDRSAHLVEWINRRDPKDANRPRAALALVERFEAEARKGTDVTALKRQVTLDLLDLLHAPADDLASKDSVETVLFAWWRSVAVRTLPGPRATEEERRAAYESLRAHVLAAR